MAKKEKATAKQPKKETAEANDSRSSVVKSSGKIKVRFLKSPLSKFRLGYGIGNEALIEKKQAEEMIYYKIAEEVK